MKGCQFSVTTFFLQSVTHHWTPPILSSYPAILPAHSCHWTLSSHYLSSVTTKHAICLAVKPTGRWLIARFAVVYPPFMVPGELGMGSPSNLFLPLFVLRQQLDHRFSEDSRGAQTRVRFWWFNFITWFMPYRAAVGPSCPTVMSSSSATGKIDYATSVVMIKTFPLFGWNNVQGDRVFATKSIIINFIDKHLLYSGILLSFNQFSLCYLLLCLPTVSKHRTLLKSTTS